MAARSIAVGNCCNIAITLIDQRSKRAMRLQQSCLNPTSVGRNIRPDEADLAEVGVLVGHHGAACPGLANTALETIWLRVWPNRSNPVAQFNHADDSRRHSQYALHSPCVCDCLGRKRHYLFRGWAADVARAPFCSAPTRSNPPIAVALSRSWRKIAISLINPDFGEQKAQSCDNA
jgi:hypothetical protein